MSSDEEESSHVIVVEGIHRLGESLFLEVGICGWSSEQNRIQACPHGTCDLAGEMVVTALLLVPLGEQ